MNVSVRLTVEQLDNLIKLFDDHFVEAIRTGENAQDMSYICEMVDVYNKLKKVQTKAMAPDESDQTETE